jgi:hypothetical protein
MENWGLFFAAQVGASAALTGLIFVSVSLSLARIIATPNLPMRAFQALVILMQILIVSSLAIVPQSLTLFGSEIVAIATPIWILVVIFDRRTMSAALSYSTLRAVGRVFISQIAALLFVIAGAGILVLGLGGIHWLVPAIICSYLVALTDAWVLLIEINR